MHRGAEVYLVRRVRLTPIADLARSPKLLELASTIERLHIACSTELATLERISSRNRPNPWSGAAILGGAAATAVGLADAIATATTGVPWFGLTLGIVGMASAAAGARDKRRETEANANLVFRDQDKASRSRRAERSAPARQSCAGDQSNRKAYSRPMR